VGGVCDFSALRMFSPGMAAESPLYGSRRALFLRPKAQIARGQPTQVGERWRGSLWEHIVAIAACARASRGAFIPCRISSPVKDWRWR